MNICSILLYFCQEFNGFNYKLVNSKTWKCMFKCGARVGGFLRFFA